MSVFTVKIGECIDNSTFEDAKNYTCVAKDAEAAIAEVKKRRLGHKFKWVDDSDPPRERTAKITAVRVCSVTHVCDLDF